MSLLHDDPAMRRGEWLRVEWFEDGAMAILDKDTKQAMHLSPDKAAQLRDVIAALDAATPDQTTKPTNPKDAVGSDKLPLHLWPTTATVVGALGLLDGALKYGRSNFRAVGVRGGGDEPRAPPPPAGISTPGSRARTTIRTAACRITRTRSPASRSLSTPRRRESSPMTGCTAATDTALSCATTPSMWPV